METPYETKCQEDVEVDIIECKNNTDSKFCGKDDPDATEYSSSFADTESDADNCSGLSEGEAETRFFGDNSLASTFDPFSNVLRLRKKKLTNHWRGFIRPLMWRCKWTELRIKEIESQAIKYSRELAAYEQRKKARFNPDMVGEVSSKSLPLPSQSYRRKAMKRRKRKKVENTNDITSYVSQHYLFSYLENKRCDLDGISTADDFGNQVKTEEIVDCDEKFGINNDSVLEFKDGDSALEQVLWKIETAHSRLHKLRSQIDMVMSKSAAKFSSSENLSILVTCDAQTSSAPSPTFSAGNGDTISAGAIYNPAQHASEFDIGDLVLPESAMSSYGEAIPVPDIIESTVGVLAAAEVTLPQPQTGDSSDEGIVDNVFIHNEAAEAETHTFSRMANPLENSKQGETNNLSSIQPSDHDLPSKTLVSEDQSTLKLCLASDVNFPRGKRKRGERKAGSGSWNKRHSGEPDSQ